MNPNKTLSFVVVKVTLCKSSAGQESLPNHVPAGDFCGHPPPLGEFPSLREFPSLGGKTKAWYKLEKEGSLAI